MARDKDLIKKRNKRIMERFNYWYNQKRLRYDDTMLKLEAEFFISKIRIEAILRSEKAKPVYVQTELFQTN